MPRVQFAHSNRLFLNRGDDHRPMSPHHKPSPQICTPGDIATVSLPWQTSKPAKRFANPKLPADPVEYAQAIPNCPPDLIEWLKAWNADQAANQPTSNDRLQTLSQILASTPLTFARLFDLGQRVQNAEGDLRRSLFFYRTRSSRWLPAELAPLAIGDPKAKLMLDMLWNMQVVLWAMQKIGLRPLPTATLLLQREPADSRAAYLAEYQFAETTYNAGNGSREAADKAMAIYQHTYWTTTVTPTTWPTRKWMA